MHSTTKEVITDKDRAKELDVPLGAHLLSTTVEADGPFQLASENAKIDGEVVSIKRTLSGGVEILTAFNIREPQPVAPAPAKSAEDQAADFLVTQGLNAGAAKAAVAKFGAARVLAKKDTAVEASQAALDSELDDLLLKK